MVYNKSPFIHPYSIHQLLSLDNIKQMKRILFSVLIILLIGYQMSCAQIRLPHVLQEPVDIGAEVTHRWKFHPGDNRNYSLVDLDDSNWNVIQSLPHDWRNPSHSPHAAETIGWYRIRLHVPKSYAGAGKLSVRMGPVHDADETFFNGVLIGRTGRIDPGNGYPTEHAWDKVRLYDIPTDLVRYGDKNVIAVRVQSFFPTEAGFRTTESTIIIGKRGDIRNTYIKEQLQILFTTTIILGIALYFLFLFIRNHENPAVLFLSLCCVAISLHHLSNTQLKYILDFDFSFYKRLEFISIISSVYLFMNYTFFHFRNSKMSCHSLKRKGVAAVNIMGILTVGPYFLIEDFIFWGRYFHLVIEPLWVLPVGLSLWIIIENAIQKEKSACFMLVGLTLCLATAINDILVDRALISSVNLSHVGFLAFILTVQQIHSLSGSLNSKLSQYPTGKPETGEPVRYTQKATLSNTMEKKMQQAETHINENFNTELSREGLASQVNISPDYLGRIFKQYKGMKINDYLRKVRIDEACRRLRESDDNIIDIAYAVGFDTLRTFNRTFLQITQMSPTQYRTTFR